MPRDDELARTATAPGSPPAGGETAAGTAGPPRALPRTRLGRFELQAVLGAGGMGVVHAAFDPELERRVALKVLHANNPDARARLLREARAMAKLSHANVITVFEVGTADGEDFVAMELIEGGTLGEWIDGAKPRPREVIAAFVAAGRGLAAAHAGGLVHRDFKPSNVLRSERGRIVVTDFGLARSGGADGRPSLPVVAPTDPQDVELTKPGSLLGTPGYMAPEQWRFETVTPATDQFAFCVALWEALAGARPFRGATLDELRAHVLAGPGGLDDGKLPRSVRPLLRRGLAVDPAKRWPSMTALLDAIERAISRRSLALAAGAGLIGAAGLAVYVASRAGGSCVPPAIDPDGVTLTPGAQPFVDTWRTARAAACDAKREVRVARLACLDGVFARIADAFHDRTPGPDALADELVDPSACDADPPPHLLTAIDGPLSTAFGVLARARDTGTPADSELAADTQPACVRAVALLARGVGLDPDYDPTVFAKAMELLAKLPAAAAGCDDDAIQARVAFATDTGDPVSFRRIDRAAQQFPSDANLTALAAARADQDVEAERIDEALAAYTQVLARHAAAGRAQAELETALVLMNLHLERSYPEDLDAVFALADRYRERARASGRGAGIVRLVARAHWRLGQVDAANREARAAGSAFSGAALTDARYPQQTVRGTVVDAAGRPVANAKVVAGAKLWGDDAELASPVAAMATIVETTTATDGSFELVGARKMAMASAGDQVSLPVMLAPGMTLRLGPTSTVEGDVVLGGEPFTRARVGVFVYGEGTSQLHAGPVDRRGHFTLSRIPRGNQQIAGMLLDDDADTAQDLDVSRPAITGVRVKLYTHRSSHNPLAVVGRSETTSVPDGAVVFVVPGARADLAGTVKDLFAGTAPEIAFLSPHDASQLEPAFAGRVEADDLTGTLRSRPDGPVTICAVGLSKKLLGTIASSAEAFDVIGDSEVRCTVVPPTDALAVVPIPPIKRR